MVVAGTKGSVPKATPDSLGALRPAFADDGTITAGNASQISDGAAAVVVADRAAAEAAGATILAEIVAYGQIGGSDATLHERPAEALRVALKRAGLEPARPRPGRDQRGLRRGGALVGEDARPRSEPGSTPEAVRWRWAIPSGRPAPGSIVTLIHALRQPGGGIGAATLCGGGGQGDALIIKVG